MFMIFSSVASFGIYTPIFYMSLHGYQEGYDVQDLVLLQTFLGLSIAFGIVISGSAINKVCQIAYRKINITRQHVCQVRVEDENDYLESGMFNEISRTWKTGSIH